MTSAKEEVKVPNESSSSNHSSNNDDFEKENISSQQLLNNNDEDDLEEHINDKIDHHLQDSSIIFNSKIEEDIANCGEELEG